MQLRGRMQVAVAQSRVNAREAITRRKDQRSDADALLSKNDEHLTVGVPRGPSPAGFQTHLGSLAALISLLPVALSFERSRYSYGLPGCVAA